jgi:hypothetical protein
MPASSLARSVGVSLTVYFFTADEDVGMTLPARTQALPNRYSKKTLDQYKHVFK